MGRARILVVALAVAALAADVVASARLAQLAGTANDLFPRWYGARAWLLHGQSPYAPEVEAGILKAMGGAPVYDPAAGLSGFVFGFVYPPYMAALLAPLAALPFPAAATLWLLLAQAALIGGLLLATQAAGDGARSAGAASGGAAAAAGVPPRPPAPSPAGLKRGRWRRGPTTALERGPGGELGTLYRLAVVAAGLLTVPAVANLAFGQFSALVFFLISLSWYLSVRGRYFGAGLALAAGLVKPQLVAVLAPAALLWSLRTSHPALSTHHSALAAPPVPSPRRFAAGLAAGAAALLGIGWLAVPDWPLAFLASTQRYATVARPASAVSLTAELLTPGIAPVLAAALSAGVIAGLAWLILRRTSPGDNATHLYAAGTIATLLVVPPLYDWNAVLLLIPLAAMLRVVVPAVATDRWRLTLATGAWGCVMAADFTLWLQFPGKHRLLWPLAIAAAWAFWELRCSPTVDGNSRP